MKTYYVHGIYDDAAHGIYTVYLKDEVDAEMKRLRERVAEFDEHKRKMLEALESQEWISAALRERERLLLEAAWRRYAIAAASQGHRHRPNSHKQIEAILAPLIAEAVKP
jgi:hypothetical protein